MTSLPVSTLLAAGVPSDALAELSSVFDVVDITGVFVNAILGGVLARQMRYDPVGFIVLGIASGLGGGMIRDTLLQQGPPVALTNPGYLVAALLGSAVAFVMTFEGKWSHRVLIIGDALALGCWASAGSTKALAAGLGVVPAMLLGVVTAVGGGIVRDLLVNRRPVIFSRGPLYATAALAGCVVTVVLAPQVATVITMSASILTAAAVCIAARRWNWTLPEPASFRVPVLPVRPVQMRSVRPRRRRRQDLG